MSPKAKTCPLLTSFTASPSDLQLGRQVRLGPIPLLRNNPENKVPFVAAVSLNEMGHPVYLKLTMMAGFTRDAIKEWASLHLAPGTVVTSDGLGCFTAVSDAGCVAFTCRLSSAIARHATCPISPGSTPSWAISRRRWQVPTSHSTTPSTPPITSLPSPTGSDLHALVVRLIVAAARCKPRSEQVIRQAETHRYSGTCLMVRVALELPLRQAEGLQTSFNELLGCELAVPDHTTVSRRAIKRLCRNSGERPV